MHKHRIIVVGNGMVGHRYLEELVDKADLSQYEVTVFGAEPREAYDRVHLSSYFSHHTAAELSLVKPGFYEKHGIKLFLNEAVKRIDRAQKVIETNQGQTLPYDTSTGDRLLPLGTEHCRKCPSRMFCLPYH
jgi:NAD(P)H-nitrite reductase